MGIRISPEGICWVALPGELHLFSLSFEHIKVFCSRTKKAYNNMNAPKTSISMIEFDLEYNRLFWFSYNSDLTIINTHSFEIEKTIRLPFNIPEIERMIAYSFIWESNSLLILTSRRILTEKIYLLSIDTEKAEKWDFTSLPSNYLA